MFENFPVTVNYADLWMQNMTQIKQHYDSSFQINEITSCERGANIICNAVLHSV